MKEILRKTNSCLCQIFLRLFFEQRTTDRYSEKIIVSLTSWTKRVENVQAVIESILKNTMKPDFIVLNLSKEEFPDREINLPQSLVDYVNRGILRIDWQDGNTKAFKKFIPTLHKFPHDIIIAIDDDFLYPKDFVETFVEAHKKWPNCPLSGNQEIIGGAQAHCGCASLVKAEYFGRYIDSFMDETIQKIGLDDVYYTFVAAMNGYYYRYVGKLYFHNMTANNPIDGLSAKNRYMNYEMFDYLHKKGMKKYKISWGRLREPIFKS